MEIEIQSKKNNPLFNRIEVRFVVSHDNEGTPRRDSIREGLAAKLNANKDAIIINHMRSTYGVHRTEGYAKVYTSQEKAKTGERTHILARHGLAEKKTKKEGAAKKPKPEAKAPAAPEQPKKEPAQSPDEKPAETEKPKDKAEKPVTDAAAPPKKQEPSTEKPAEKKE